MSIEDISAEQLAKLFHHYRGALAHDFDCQSDNDTSSSWDRAPQHESKLLVAAARLTLLELTTAPARAPVPVGGTSPRRARPIGDADRA